VINAAHDLNRAVSRTPAEPEDVAADSVSESDAGAALVREAVQRLPARQRDALYLRYYLDLEYRAIADVLDMEVGTVSATLLRSSKLPQGRIAGGTTMNARAVEDVLDAAVVVPVAAATVAVTNWNGWWSPHDQLQPLTEPVVVQTGSWDGKRWQLVAYREAGNNIDG
jgi:hypothetical protein